METEKTKVKIAKYVRQIEGWNGDARLYRLTPPLASEPLISDEPVCFYEYVVVSAVDAPFSGPETLIFGANEGGYVDDFGELPGSYTGGLSHYTALGGAGYTVEL